MSGISIIIHLITPALNDMNAHWRCLLDVPPIFALMQKRVEPKKIKALGQTALNVIADGPARPDVAGRIAGPPYASALNLSPTSSLGLCGP